MSQFTCPCGFNVSGYGREAWAAYRAHGCEHHAAEPVDVEEMESHSSGMSWPGLIGWIALLVFLAFICSGGFGRFW